jgi:hypothetical protein
VINIDAAMLIDTHAHLDFPEFAEDLDLSSDLLSLATLGSVKLVVSYRCINNCGAFRCVVKFGLCGEISREENSIDIHSNIRLLLALMLKHRKLTAGMA